MAKNIASNLLGAIVPLALTLITVPLYLSGIGAARYGVVLIAWSILGYFGFMDLGISRATTNALSKIAQDPPSSEKERIFWSSFIVNGCLGVIGGIILYLAVPYLFLHVLEVEAGIREEVSKSAIYIAFMLPLTLMMGVGVGTVEAHEKFPVLNLIQSTGLILSQTLPLISILIFGPSLVHVMLTMLGVRCLTFATVTLFALKVAKIPFNPIIDLHRVKSLFAFGGWITVSNIVGPLMYSIDQVLIGAVRGVASLPTYAIPMNIISGSQILPMMLTRALFPVFSRVDGVMGRAIVGTTLSHLCTLTTIVYVGVIFLCDPLLRLWLGSRFAGDAALVLELLVLGAWFNSLAFVVYSALQGQGRVKIVAIIHTMEVLPYAALLWIMLNGYGLRGAAIAWSIRAAVDSLLLANAFRIDRATLGAIFPGLIAVLLAFWAVQTLDMGLLGRLIGTMIVVLSFLAVSFIANPHFKSMVTTLAGLGPRRAGANVSS